MAVINVGFAVLLLVAACQAQPHADWIHEPARVRRAAREGPHRSGAVARPAAALLAEEAGTGATAGARAARIMREIGGAEHEVAKVMHGHPEELRQEEELLHQASELTLRAGQMASHRAAARPRRASLLQSKAAAGAGAAAAAELASMATQEVKLTKTDGKLYREAVEAQAAASAALQGKDKAQVLELMGEVQEAQRKVVASDLGELKETRKLGRELKAGRAGHHSTKGASAAGMAVVAAAEERAYAKGQAKLAREGHHLEGEIRAAKAQVAAAVGKRDAKAAAEVQKLMSEALSEQQQVVRAEAHDARDAEERAKKIASASTAHRSALLQRSGESSAYAASLAHRSQQLRVLASQRVRMAREGARLLRQTGRAKAAVLKDLAKAGAGQAKVAEVSQLLSEAVGAAKKVASDERKTLALTKKELHTAAALARQ